MDSSDMVLLTSSTGPHLDYYVENDEWDLLGTGFQTDYYTDSFGNYSAVRFQISMQRRPSFYVITMLLPVFLLSFLNSCCFLVPPDSGEKINLSMSMFLAFVLLLTILTAELPSSSRNMFVFEITICINLIMSGITVILSTLIVNLCNTSDIGLSLSSLRRVTCTQCKNMCKKCHERTEDATSIDKRTNSVVETKSYEEVTHNIEGKVFAKRLDRILFRLSVFINVILACVFFSFVLS